MPPVDRRQFLASGAALSSLPLASSFSFAKGSNSQVTSSTRTGTSKQGVVATVHPIASRAAVQAFRRGGNAIDAAAAASIMLTVVDGFNSGIGGGCLAMIRTADGNMLALDGREKAPALAKPEMFFRNGKPDPKLSQVGPLAAGVPGLLAALDRLTSDHGKLTLADAFAGAAEVAAQGFVLDENYVRRLRLVAKSLKRFPSSAEILLDSGRLTLAARAQASSKRLRKDTH